MAKALELTWVAKLRQWRKRRNVGGKRKDFYLGTGNGPDDRESYRRALGKWKVREHWLESVLRAQVAVRQNGPPEFANLSLITLAELHEIRRIWLYEKHEFDDSLPRIYQAVTGEPFPTLPDDQQVFGQEDWTLLRELCGTDDALFNVAVSMVNTEREFRGMIRRVGVFDELEECLKSGLYANEEEAVEVLTNRQRTREDAHRELFETTESGTVALKVLYDS